MTCTLGGVSTPQLSVDARPGVRAVMLRWLLVSLILTGVIAMHVLSQHDPPGEGDEKGQRRGKLDGVGAELQNGNSGKHV